jgi:PAS domain S-box-containing protein
VDADPRDARIAELERRVAELTAANEILTTSHAPPHQDQRERQRWEAACRERESFYLQTLESIPGIVFTSDPNGVCDYVNEQWVEFTGVPATHQDEDFWLRLIHPDDHARLFAAWRAGVESTGQYDLELRLRRADGAYEWFMTRGRAIRDAAGAVVRWFGTAVNVDDLKQAEAALVARERELQALADNSPDILSRFDRELRHVFVNASIETATGIEREEFLGKTNGELGMPTELCELWDTTIRTVFAHGRPQSFEFVYDTPNGPRHYSVQLVPELGPSGEVEHVLGVTHDTTESKQAQQALEDADRHKDEFLATLAHELRNPLAPILNGLEILRRRGAKGHVVNAARNMMERQLRHLVRLVDDLLDVSRISRGLVELELARVSVQTVLDHAVEISRPLIDAWGQTLTVQAPGAPVWVDGDLTRLAQVVGNLLNNAAKYSHSSGRIRLSAVVEGGDAVIRVADDGIGLAADMLPRVFGLFAQVNRTLHRAQGGLGIGLSLARKLVELHGGVIMAESPGLGGGSTFTVRLPLAPVAAAAGAGSARDLVGSTVLQGRRILVVDDYADGAETLAMLLELAGHEVALAGSGPAALTAARVFRPEVVFLDIGMPGMDGYEVARRLRADPATADAVLVALTGWGSEDDKRKSSNAGFDLHLVKPAAPDVVADVLARLSTLDRHGSGDEQR